MAYSGGALAAAYAAMAQAVKASGAIVSVEPDAFMTLLSRTEKPLVVTAKARWPGRGHQYLTGYKGLIFFTKSSTPLTLPGSTEVVIARQIWIPR